MNLSETALMLAQMQAYDQRTVGESDVIAWQALLVDASFQDCQEAIRQHYSESTDRIMPAHVRRLVRDMERARQVSPWAPGQHGIPRGEAVPEVATGQRLALSDLPAAVADLVAQVRAGLPEGRRETLAPRRVAWEREHQAYLRHTTGEPNPYYRPDRVALCAFCDTGLFEECPTHGPKAAEALRDSDGFCAGGEGCRHLVPIAATCAICGTESQDIAAHRRDHPDGSCA